MAECTDECRSVSDSCKQCVPGRYGVLCMVPAPMLPAYGWLNGAVTDNDALCRCDDVCFSEQIHPPTQHTMCLVTTMSVTCSNICNKVQRWKHNQPRDIVQGLCEVHQGDVFWGSGSHGVRIVHCGKIRQGRRQCGLRTVSGRLHVPCRSYTLQRLWTRYVHTACCHGLCSTMHSSVVSVPLWNAH